MHKTNCSKPIQYVSGKHNESKTLTRRSCIHLSWWTRGGKSIAAFSKSEFFFSNVLPGSFLLTTLTWRQWSTTPMRPLPQITLHVLTFTWTRSAYVTYQICSQFCKAIRWFFSNRLLMLVLTEISAFLWFCYTRRQQATAVFLQWVFQGMDITSFSCLHLTAFFNQRFFPFTPRFKVTRVSVCTFAFTWKS